MGERSCKVKKDKMVTQKTQSGWRIRILVSLITDFSLLPSILIQPMCFKASNQSKFASIDVVGSLADAMASTCFLL